MSCLSLPHVLGSILGNVLGDVLGKFDSNFHPEERIVTPTVLHSIDTNTSVLSSDTREATFWAVPTAWGSNLIP